jgi:hypothetical protein
LLKGEFHPGDAVHIGVKGRGGEIQLERLAKAFSA